MGMTSSKPYLFRAILEWLEDNDMTPHISVDVMFDGVLVPLEYAKDGQIVLNIASQSIELFSLDNKALHFSARFNGMAQDLYIPMGAILAIYARENGQGMFFEAEEIAESSNGDNSSLESVDGSDMEKSKVKPNSVSTDKKPNPSGSKPIDKSKGKVKSKKTKRDSSHLKVIK